MLPKRQIQNRLAIATIAGQQLITSFASQHNFDVLRSEQRNEVKRNARGMCERLIFMPNKPRQRVED